MLVSVRQTVIERAYVARRLLAAANAAPQLSRPVHFGRPFGARFVSLGFLFVFSLSLGFKLELQA